VQKKQFTQNFHQGQTFLVTKIIEVTDWMKNDEQMHLEKH
jgi:hypothetical protein